MKRLATRWPTHAQAGAARPGLVLYGVTLAMLMRATLGDAQVNIAGMQVSRDTKGGRALVALSVDSAVPNEVLGEIREAISARVVRGVDLSEQP